MKNLKVKVKVKVNNLKKKKPDRNVTKRNERNERKKNKLQMSTVRKRKKIHCPFLNSCKALGRLIKNTSRMPG